LDGAGCFAEKRRRLGSNNSRAEGSTRTFLDFFVGKHYAGEVDDGEEKELRSLLWKFQERSVAKGQST
jgi:hypothetical protein